MVLFCSNIAERSIIISVILFFNLTCNRHHCRCQLVSVSLLSLSLFASISFSFCLVQNCSRQEIIIICMIKIIKLLNFQTPTSFIVNNFNRFYHGEIP